MNVATADPLDVDIFEELTPKQIELVESICQEKNYNKNEVIRLRSMP